VTVLEIDTPEGLARADLHAVPEAAGALALGHGAAGGFGAPDLVAVIDVAQEAGWTVAAVEQPYRVAGRRSPPRTERLDAAWTAALERLRADELQGLPLIVGGRSSGARVACRTAAATGAVAVLCLAFPVHPPGRHEPAKSRQPELDAVSVPTLVVQGDADPFGMPEPGPNRTVVIVPGNHSLRAGLEPLAEAVGDWLARFSGS
jgi:predicted alpha/beta-hydrolase family hydrolase